MDQLSLSADKEKASKHPILFLKEIGFFGSDAWYAVACHLDRLINEAQNRLMECRLEEVTITRERLKTLRELRDLHITYKNIAAKV